MKQSKPFFLYTNEWISFFKLILLEDQKPGRTEVKTNRKDK